MKWRICLCLFLMLLGAASLSCSKKDGKPESQRLRVVTTLFPLYDFTRQIGGEKIDVHLLLPPGMEPHSFEPKPDDIMRINRAELFVYTNSYMEPWAANLLKGVAGDRLKVIEAGAGAHYLPAAEADEHGEEHGDAHRMDPHIWLSIPNAEKMVDNIAAGLAAKDAANSKFYLDNAASYKKRLSEMDKRFVKGLSDCPTKMFMHGGHYAFGYLARRYGLTYMSAYALSANAEPSPRKLVDLVNRIKQNRLHAIFYEEIISPAMAEMIARETGTELVKLHGIHNVSKSDLDRGVTYLSLMEQNLENLRKGLQCR